MKSAFRLIYTFISLLELLGMSSKGQKNSPLAFVAGAASSCGVQRQIHKDRFVRPLRTGSTRTKMAVDAYLAKDPLVIDMIRSSISELFRMLKLAS